MGNFPMREVNLDVIHQCTLSCKLCASYDPYMIPYQRTYPLETLIKSVGRYFEAVSSVNIFTLSGGEPLLFRELPDLLNYMKKYNNRIKEMRIVTNGTLPPSQELLAAVQEYGDKFYFIVDDYGPGLSVQIGEIKKLFARRHIRYTIRNYTKENTYCGGWVDFGDILEKRHLPDAAKDLFSKCISAPKCHACFPLTNGELWSCHVARYLNLLGIAGDESEHINLLDASLSVEALREKIKALYEKECLSACAYCGGFCEDSERFEPAEQLTGEEKTCIRAGARSYTEVLEMLKDQTDQAAGTINKRTQFKHVSDML